MNAAPLLAMHGGPWSAKTSLRQRALWSICLRRLRHDPTVLRLLRGWPGVKIDISKLRWMGISPPLKVSTEYKIISLLYIDYIK